MIDTDGDPGCLDYIWVRGKVEGRFVPARVRPPGGRTTRRCSRLTTSACPRDSVGEARRGDASGSPIEATGAAPRRTPSRRCSPRSTFPAATASSSTCGVRGRRAGPAARRRRSSASRDVRRGVDATWPRRRSRRLASRPSRPFSPRYPRSVPRHRVQGGRRGRRRARAGGGARPEAAERGRLVVPRRPARSGRPAAPGWKRWLNARASSPRRSRRPREPDVAAFPSSGGGLTPGAWRARRTRPPGGRGLDRSPA